jgi:hypothetical protein
MSAMIALTNGDRHISKIHLIQVHFITISEVDFVVKRMNNILLGLCLQIYGVTN